MICTPIHGVYFPREKGVLGLLSLSLSLSLAELTNTYRIFSFFRYCINGGISRNITRIIPRKVEN